jgi:hypothetical protein
MVSYFSEIVSYFFEIVSCFSNYVSVLATNYTNYTNYFSFFYSCYSCYSWLKSNYQSLFFVISCKISSSSPVKSKFACS